MTMIMTRPVRATLITYFLATSAKSCSSSERRFATPQRDFAVLTTTSTRHNTRHARNSNNDNDNNSDSDRTAGEHTQLQWPVCRLGCSVVCTPAQHSTATATAPARSTHAHSAGALDRTFTRTAAQRSRPAPVNYSF